MDLSERPWLIELPDSFDQHFERIRITNEKKDPVGKGLRWISSHKIKSRELQRLSGFVQANWHDHDALNPLDRFTLGVVSNASLDVLAPGLVGSALAYGIALKVEMGPFDQAAQLAASSSHPFFKTTFDAILYAPFWEGLPLSLDNNAENTQALINKVCQRIRFEIEGISERSDVPVIVQTLSSQPQRIFGNIDRIQTFGLEHMIWEINETLLNLSQQGANVLLDFQAIASNVGRDRFFSSRDWHWSKQPLAKEHTVIYLDHLARTIGAMRGKSRRVLILDLDNTLWGGVIGDDGMDGIILGQGSTKGEAYLSVQKAVMLLKSRGVILAVCSKNEEAIAKEPFNNHSEMLIKENDIAVFVADWGDKASNIELISKTLNLGLDAMVFVDDNPVERAQVRHALPEVAVPELPKNPSDFANILLASGYFESVVFTEADKDRAEQYAANARRTNLQTKSADLTEFLTSLNMKARVGFFNSSDRSRITQLINKSNQFNLTTIRYTEKQIDSFGNDSETGAFDFRLKDDYGDNGLIAVIICKNDNSETTGDSWQIDTWVMSCRVLGRKMEEACLNAISSVAKERGKKCLIGKYSPTDRNSIVADLYTRLGFSKLPGGLEGEQLWRLDLKLFEPFIIPIQIEGLLQNE